MKKPRFTELITNPDGSVYHLGIRPEHVAQDVILVGDPGRVEKIAMFLDKTEFSHVNREFHLKTGWYRGHRVSILSTGIGTDNMEIVVTELDALVNHPLFQIQEGTPHRRFCFMRVGTSGTIQKDIPPGSFIMTERSIGLDGLLHFYAGTEKHRDREWEEAFFKSIPWPAGLPVPYITGASVLLSRHMEHADFFRGMTLSAPGFYAPQVRTIRAGLRFPELLEKFTDFRYRDKRILNFEMESSVLYGLSRLLGHEAMTVCMVLANRLSGEFYPDHGEAMDRLIKTIMDLLPFPGE